MVDKNLFLYDLAVVAILKNEGAYLKEWLDYHLLAGVDHFYLYDNDSTDNQAAVVAPYVEAGLVDYLPAHGKAMQYVVYNDAVKRFKFQCRYMTFIDGDEFIFPRTGQSIVELVDEILSHSPNAAGVIINWQFFGSNGHETADLSRGVLERFTRRANTDWHTVTNDKISVGNFYWKSVINPRLADFVHNAHSVYCFNNLSCVNSEGIIDYDSAEKHIVAADKIVVNHYSVKSREEYIAKKNRGRAAAESHRLFMEDFSLYDRNEVFDDGILKYRAARAENFLLEDTDARLNRVTTALTEILSAYASGKIFSLETALTCLALSSYLRENFPAERWKVYEETSLAAILKSVDNASSIDLCILIRKLPKILCLPYPAVNVLRKVVSEAIEQLKTTLRMNNRWRSYVELDYLQDILKLGG